MARLDAAARNALPDSDFAGPGRTYPIEDAAHARNAKARVSQFGTPAEKAKVDAAVSRRYPAMGKASPAAKKQALGKVAAGAGRKKGRR